MGSVWGRRIGVSCAAVTAVCEPFAGYSSPPGSEEAAFWNWLISDLIPITPGDAEGLFIAFSRVGYSGPIELSAADVPAGITVNVVPSHVTGSLTVATIHVAGGMATGNYQVTIDGIVAGQSEQKLPITVMVH